MIRIVTDSAADLTARDLETPGVTVVPMGITFADGTATVDDGSMTKDEFFTRLAEDSKLSPRETEVFMLLAQGRSHAFIQDDLGLARGTVNAHVSHIYAKMNVADRQGLLDRIWS